MPVGDTLRHEAERTVAQEMADNGSWFEPAQLYAAAKMYYDDETTQADVAVRLGVSRATVSRMLAEARRRGIVRIDVVPPHYPSSEDLATRLTDALGLDRVYLSARLPAVASTNLPYGKLGQVLAPAVAAALRAARLRPGDVLLVSSGRTMYEVAQSDLPSAPGVLVAPTLGGADEPEGWFQTNEIVRLVAERIGGRANYLFAPALPGPDLYQTLQHDPAIQRVLHLWPQARCVLAGVGSPPTLRSQTPTFLPAGSATLRQAVGDLCSRFYNRAGEPVAFPGSERLIGLELTDLRKIPTVIGVAAGTEKAISIAVAARAGYFNQLVTDPTTAEQVLAVAAELEPSGRTLD